VRGPHAASGSPRRFWNLAMTLAATDWKVRFFGSALGYLWSLLRPLMLFGILYFIFSEVVDAGAGVQDYPVMLLMAMILFFCFSEITGGALTSMVDREALLRKIGFPRAVVPLAVALVAVFNLGLNLVVLGVFMVLSGVEPQWTWLLLPIPVVLLLTFATGVAMLLSALYVRFRDVRPIWEVFMQALFYATPILYPIERLIAKSDTLGHIALINPVAAIIQESRYLLLGSSSPSLSEAMGSTWMALVPVAVLIGLTALGGVVFHRLAPTIAEEL
jgi:ABC-2 type transport system permease protein